MLARPRCSSRIVPGTWQRGPAGPGGAAEGLRRRQEAAGAFPARGRSAPWRSAGRAALAAWHRAPAPGLRLGPGLLAWPGLSQGGFLPLREAIACQGVRGK